MLQREAIQKRRLERVHNNSNRRHSEPVTLSAALVPLGPSRHKIHRRHSHDKHDEPLWQRPRLCLAARRLRVVRIVNGPLVVRCAAERREAAAAHQRCGGQRGWRWQQRSGGCITHARRRGNCAACISGGKEAPYHISALHHTASRGEPLLFGSSKPFMVIARRRGRRQQKNDASGLSHTQVEQREATQLAQKFIWRRSRSKQRRKKYLRRIEE